MSDLMMLIESNDIAGLFFFFTMVWSIFSIISIILLLSYFIEIKKKCSRYHFSFYGIAITLIFNEHSISPKKKTRKIKVLNKQIRAMSSKGILSFKFSQILKELLKRERKYISCLDEISRSLHSLGSKSESSEILKDQKNKYEQLLKNIDSCKDRIITTLTKIVLSSTTGEVEKANFFVEIDGIIDDIDSSFEEMFKE